MATALADRKHDILVLGATGYTGRLITRYLAAHPQRNHFTLALGARSTSKLDALVQDLNLPASVKLVQVNVMRDPEINRAVSDSRVVINTVGPFWTYGTPVVRSCVKYGTHYVDLTGEAFWIHQIVREFDFAATKTGSIIVPGCGFDSVPSDVSAYLANKTLKSLPPSPSTNGGPHQMGLSTSAFDFKGGISGGTVASMINAVARVPHDVMDISGRPYALSPFLGRVRQTLSAIYNLAIPGERSILGGFFLMAPGNIQLVQRTYGLFELQERNVAGAISKNLAQQATRIREARHQRYGPQFSYSEFMVVHSRIQALVIAMFLGTAALLVMWGPTRWLVNKVVPQSGEGPTDTAMQKGFFKTTNLTISASDPSVQVKTVVKGKGDPGYLLTAIMVSECALAVVLPPASTTKKLVGPPAPRDPDQTNRSALPLLAKIGGVLTPMTAFGDVLIQRLEETGRFEFSSSVLDVSNGRRSD